MITVTLNDWEERELQNKVAQKCVEKIIASEFKLYGDILEEGCYTPHDKFKNYVANLVADRIYQYMVDNDEIKNRIGKAIENAEKTIVKQYMVRMNGGVE
jgi:hypothetical protein